MDVRAAPACLLCDRPGLLLHTNLEDRIFDAPGAWSHRFCAQCGLTWLDPQPLPASIPELYEQYFTHVEEVPAPSAPLKEWVRNVAARTAIVQELIGARVLFLPPNPGGEVLDVGCGSGTLLSNLQQIGWSVSGIEPEPVSAALAARRLGQPVFTGGIEAAPLEANRYDAITVNHVIEHLPDPIGALAKCAHALKPGGRLVLVTPNSRSLGRRIFGTDWLGWDAPRHLFIFDAASLREIVRRAGLRVVTERTLSRKARWSWRAGRMIRRSLRPTQEGAPSSMADRLGATLFHLIEHAVTRVTPAGEELLLIATK